MSKDLLVRKIAIPHETLMSGNANQIVKWHIEHMDYEAKKLLQNQGMFAEWESIETRAHHAETFRATILERRYVVDLSKEAPNV